ncbi:MAG: hypothetical protein JW915_05910 [Chitinispirillaceae bacterium]|nr:hypothetical protein [Chitinispirillaceae bacterium]
MDNNIIKLTVFLLVSAITIQFVSCTVQSAGGVETTNGITYAIKGNQISGFAPAGSEIILCNSEYKSTISFDPLAKSFIETVIADDDETFRFNLPVDGIYNIIGRNRNFDNGVIIKKIHIDRSDTCESSLSPIYEYKQLGSITGKVYVENEYDSTCEALVSVVGTGLSCHTDSGGAYIIDKIPAGTYIVYASTRRKSSKPAGTDDYCSVSVDNITVENYGFTNNVDLKFNNLTSD